MKRIKEYLKGKISDRSTSSKNKNIRRLYRDITGFNVGRPPRSKFVKNGNGDIL
jgi:hypothetical protein